MTTEDLKGVREIFGYIIQATSNHPGGRDPQGTAYFGPDDVDEVKALKLVLDAEIRERLDNKESV